MKLDQQQQAQHLYFQTDLNKSEIAENIGISRRTLHYWIQQNNWDRLKKSAEYIPSFLAENCYQVLGRLTEHILSDERINEPATIQEVNAMYKLTLTINKLKNRSTLNESMEMLGWFSESLDHKDPALAKQLQPHIDEYIASRATPNYMQCTPSKLNESGYIPCKDPVVAQTEAKLDAEDRLAFAGHTEAKSDRTGAEGRESPAPKSVQPVPGIDRPKAEKSIREMLRGTATTGPGRSLRNNRSLAA